MFRDLHENADIILFILFCINLAAGIWFGYWYANTKRDEDDTDHYNAGYTDGYNEALQDAYIKLVERHRNAGA